MKFIFSVKSTFLLPFQGRKGIKGPKGLPGENGCCGAKVRLLSSAVDVRLQRSSRFSFFKGHKGEPGRFGVSGTRGEDGDKGKRGLVVSFTSLVHFARFSSRYYFAFHEYVGAFFKRWLQP